MKDFFSNHFKATTQSLKKEIAFESHASLFETHSTVKMQWIFFWVKILNILKNTPNFKVKPKPGYVEDCMIFKYVKPKSERE